MNSNGYKQNLSNTWSKPIASTNCIIAICGSSNKKKSTQHRMTTMTMVIIMIMTMDIGTGKTIMMMKTRYLLLLQWTYHPQHNTTIIKGVVVVVVAVKKESNCWQSWSGVWDSTVHQPPNPAHNHLHHSMMNFSLAIIWYYCCITRYSSNSKSEFVERRRIDREE